LRLWVESRQAEIATFQFVVFASLRFLNLGNRRAGSLSSTTGDLYLFEDIDVRHGSILQLSAKMDNTMDSIDVTH